MYRETSLYHPADYDIAVIVSVDPLIGKLNIISGLFTKFQKEAISFITSVSVCTSTRNNSVPSRFLWNSISESFIKISLEN